MKVYGHEISQETQRDERPQGKKTALRGFLSLSVDG
jgi:hypothetical protein